MTNQELIQEWENNLRHTKKKSEDTIKSYIETLVQFNKHINKLLIEVIQKDIDQFVGNPKWSLNTTMRKYATLRTFFNWMINYDYISKHPIKEKMVFGRSSQKPKYLHREDKCDVIAYLEERKQAKGNYVNDRNYVIYLTMYNTGMRKSEIIKLTVRDLNLYSKRPSVKVTRKGDKEQYLPLNREIVAELKRYLREYEIKDGYVFRNDEGGSLASVTISKLFEKIKEKTGVMITPHMTRHTFATELIDNGKNVRVVQELLGHENLNTTQKYVHISSDQLSNAVECLNKRR
jgi:site-specific recombinase XerD